MSRNSTKAAEPMDPSAREGASPTHVTRNVRNAYALDTLLAEVNAAFGEVPVIYGQPDEWQVIHEATFDAHGIEHFVDVLTGIYHDPRVLEVDSDDDDTTFYVSIVRNRRIRDTRDGFGLAAILQVYREDDNQDDDIETIHIVGADGVCRISLNGQGHLPCETHEPEPVEEPVAPEPKKRAPRKTAAKKAASK